MHTRRYSATNDMICNSIIKLFQLYHYSSDPVINISIKSREKSVVIDARRVDGVCIVCDMCIVCA